MTGATVATPSLEVRTICQLEGDLSFLQELVNEDLKSLRRAGNAVTLTTAHCGDLYAMVMGIIRKTWTDERRDFDAYLAAAKAEVAAWQDAHKQEAV